MRYKVGLALVLALTFTSAFFNGYAQAFVPYQSYTYDFWGEATPATQAYVPDRAIDGRALGVGDLRNPSDLFVQGDRIYLLDSGNRRLIVLDSDWHVLQVVTEFTNAGEVDRFRNPQGVYVTESGLIYVADRDAGRIVVLDQDTTVVKIIGPPDVDVDGVITSGFTYLPKRLGVDQAERVYVISDGVYDGLLEFDSDGNFRGFVGAPRVAPSLFDYVWSRLSTREQRRRRALFLPIEYSNIDIDERGFIYATVSGGATVEGESVRRLNPTGIDVLRRTGFDPPIGDVDFPHEESTAQIRGRSLLVDVVAREEGMYSVLDNRRGRVFTYDGNGNLLYVFGGRGDQIGTARNPVALAQVGDQLAILDAGNNRVTLYRPTDFAIAIHEAIKAHNRGDYDLATSHWQDVLRLNANYTLGYSGIGRSLLRQGDYAQAMEQFKLGHDRVGYSKAFALYRREVISRNFSRVMTALLAVSILAYVLVRRRRKARLLQAGTAPGTAEVAATAVRDFHLPDGYDPEKPRSPVQETIAALKYALYVIFHPFDGFWDLKNEKRGNAAAATIILILVTLTYAFMRQYTGFVYNALDPNRLNLLMEFAAVMVPFGLWTVVNWSLTTLTEGKGTLKDIYIATAYALTPIILINVPLTVISNYMTMEEFAFYATFLVFSFMWSMALIFFGNMTIHDFFMGKGMLMSVLSVVGMGIVIFIALLFVSLVGEITGFFSDIYMEVVYRL